MTKKQKTYQDLPQNTRQKIAQNATAWAKEKRKSGERATLTVVGKAEEIAIIRNAIALHGGNNIKALTQICQDFIDKNTPE